jgi:hypothetical protein
VEQAQRPLDRARHLRQVLLRRILGPLPACPRYLDAIPCRSSDRGRGGRVRGSVVHGRRKDGEGRIGLRGASETKEIAVGRRPRKRHLGQITRVSRNFEWKGPAALRRELPLRGRPTLQAFNKNSPPRGLAELVRAAASALSSPPIQTGNDFFLKNSVIFLKGCTFQNITNIPTTTTCFFTATAREEHFTIYKKLAFLYPPPSPPFRGFMGLLLQRAEGLLLQRAGSKIELSTHRTNSVASVLLRGPNKCVFLI